MDMHTAMWGMLRRKQLEDEIRALKEKLTELEEDAYRALTPGLDRFARAFYRDRNNDDEWEAQANKAEALAISERLEASLRLLLRLMPSVDSRYESHRDQFLSVADRVPLTWDAVRALRGEAIQDLLIDINKLY
jgi:hypothetical protein